MKQSKKLLIAIALIFAVSVSAIPFSIMEGTQVVVQASTVKLNKKTISLDVGKAQKLKVTGTKAKVKWSSTNSRVVKVNKSGVVTAVSSGSATVKAKVGKKTLSCKVTVKSQFSASEATKNISVTLEDTGKGVVAILKNNNKVTVDVEAKLVYFLNGRMIDTSSDSNYAFESGKECALFFPAPMNSDYDYVSYDDFKITLSVDKTNYIKCASNGIDVKSNIGADNVTTEISNNSGMDFDYIKIAIVFYNASGKAIGYEYHYANCLKDGSVDYLSFDFPYDDNYETLYPSRYEVYVNEAYTYTW